MSGLWSIEGIENNDELWEDGEPSSMLIPSHQTSDGRTKRLDIVTSAMIWMLPFVGIDEITPQNVEDTFSRIRMLELAMGPLFKADGKGSFVTLDEVRRRIGLCVGAGMSLRPFEETLVNALKTRATEALREAKDSA